MRRKCLDTFLVKVIAQVNVLERNLTSEYACPRNKPNGKETTTANNYECKVKKSRLNFVWTLANGSDSAYPVTSIGCLNFDCWNMRMFRDDLWLWCCCFRLLNFVRRRYYMNPLMLLTFYLFQYLLNATWFST